MKKTHSIKKLFCGIGVGFVNALLGAGGGMLAVPALKGFGMKQREAHVNSVAVIMPLSLMSSFMYLKAGNVGFSDALPYVLPGILGAAAGSVIIKHISNGALNKIFALFMIWAGIRLLLK